MPLVGEQCIVMSMSVCVFVRKRTVSLELHVQSLPNFTCMLIWLLLGPPTAEFQRERHIY